MSESPDNISSRAANRASDLKQRIKHDSKQRIESGKRTAADQMEEIADAIDDAGATLDESQPTLANYASQLAGGMGSLATRLRDDSIEDLYRDARRLATEHPGMFLLGGAALGLAVARFMKAESTDSGLGMKANMSDREVESDSESIPRSGVGSDLQSDLGMERPLERPAPYDRSSGPAAGV
jgi:hypothetical protein